MKRGFVRLVRGAVAACAVLACLAQPGRAEDLVVSLWGTGMMGVAHAVAMEKGFYREAGLDITGIIGAPGGGNVIRTLLANSLPYGEVATPAAIAAQRAGLPIVVVNSAALAADNVWVARADSNLTLKDLKGHKAAYTTPKSISEAFLRMALRGAGLDNGEVTLVAAGGVNEGLTLLDNEKVDTALIVEPLNTLRGSRYKPVFAVRDTLPPIMSVVGVTTRDFAAQNGDKIRKIIAARQKAVKFLYAHPDEAGKIMAQDYHIAAEAGVEAVTRMSKVGYWLEGDFDIALLQHLADGLQLTGELSGPVDWASLIDTSMLPDDLRAKSKLTP